MGPSYPGKVGHFDRFMREHRSAAGHRLGLRKLCPKYQTSAASRFGMGVSVGGYVVDFARNPVVDRNSGESHYP